MEDKVSRFKNGGPSLNFWLQAGEFWTEKVAAEGWRLVQAVAGNGQQQDLQRRVRPPTIWTNAHKFRPVYRREQVLWKRVYRRSDPFLFSRHPIPVRHWIRDTYAIRWVMQGCLKVKRRFKEVSNNFVLVTVMKFNQNPKSLHKATSYCCSNKELLLHVLHLIKLLVFPSPLQPLQCDFLYFDDLTVNYIYVRHIGLANH